MHLPSRKPQDAFQRTPASESGTACATLDEIRTRQEDLSAFNRELEDTNRGVVALYAELDEKADHLRRADELKSKFLSNMSHEFRSPLNSILALSGLLLGSRRWRPELGTGAAGRLYPQGRGRPARAGQRFAGSGQSGGRQNRSPKPARIRSRATSSARFAACCGRSC